MASKSSYKLHRFDQYSLTEYKKFSDFPGALRFGDWSKFNDKLKKATDKGFSTVEELLSAMDMDKQFYDKVKHNMINNWQDSVSKSLLHGISGVDLEIPETGDVIFKTPKDQSKFLIVAGPGYNRQSIMYGQNDITHGLNLWGGMFLQNAANGKSTQRLGEIDLTLDKSKYDKLDKVLQYIWIYVFFNDYLAKKQNVKLPKALYRGIRASNLYQYDAIKKIIEGIKVADEGAFRYEKCTREKMDLIFEYIIKNGLSEITDGSYLSFTSSKSAAEYFANSEGFLIKIDPKKVRVVASPLTDEAFDEYNYMSKRKEQEYIVMLPDNYKFEKDDIIPSSEDYLIGAHSPLAVPFFGHDDKKATYKIHVPEKNETYDVGAAYSWSSNTSGKVLYTIRDSKGKELTYYESAAKVKKELGFNPEPNEKNLDQITEFSIKPKKSF